uniref:uncharacterized protein isoform X2 n=1 Tax=Myxine glutinosa TaxID=7769 RepID=UPI00358EAD4C
MDRNFGGHPQWTAVLLRPSTTRGRTYGSTWHLCQTGSPTMYAQVGCEKDSCHVQPASEQLTVLVCGMKVEEPEGFPVILQIKIEDVNSFGLEEEQRDQPNDLFVKAEVKTEHDIDVHLDRPEPNDAEASFPKNHPHEALFVEVKTEHDIDVQLDRREPIDAEAPFLKNHPHEDLFVKAEVKTEHDIDVHLDRPEPNDAEASFPKNHPHEALFVEVKTEHDIDVQLDQREPIDAEAPFLKNHPHEGFCQCLYILI